MAPRRWNKNRICEDDEVWGYNRAFSVTEFLKAINSPRLKDVPEFALWIEEAARRYDVDQRFLLVTAEKEQSFLTRRAGGRGWKRALDYTLGFGATDSHDIPKYKGTKTQVFSCARAVGTWYREAAAAKVGKPWKLADGTVVPENAATAAQYMYTPHINGAKVFWLVWNRWRKLLEATAMRKAEIIRPIMVAINNGQRDEERIAGYLIKDPNTGKVETFVKLREFVGDVEVPLEIGNIEWSHDPAILHMYTGDFPDEYKYRPPEPAAPTHDIIKYPRATVVRFDDSELDGPGSVYYNPWPQLTRGLIDTSTIIDQRLADHFVGREFLVYGSRARFLKYAPPKAQREWIQRFPRYCRIHPRLVELLEEIRQHFDTPVKIISGYRPYYYNKFIGGASKSFHMAGMAADIIVTEVPVDEVVAYLRSRHPKGGRGIARTWMHVDVRPWAAEWYY